MARTASRANRRQGRCEALLRRELGFKLAHNKTPESDVKPNCSAVFGAEFKKKSACGRGEKRLAKASAQRTGGGSKRFSSKGPKGEAVVHPLSNHIRKARTMAMTGIDPRHRPHYLSLLPSGPDEVRNRLLRGGRSGWVLRPGYNPSEGIQPRVKRISGTGHR